MWLSQTHPGISQTQRIRFSLNFYTDSLCDLEEAIGLCQACFFLFFFFFNYESMKTHLQEAWKIQIKVAYSSTKYYNNF